MEALEDTLLQAILKKIANDAGLETVFGQVSRLEEPRWNDRKTSENFESASSYADNIKNKCDNDDGGSGKADFKTVQKLQKDLKDLSNLGDDSETNKRALQQKVLGDIANNPSISPEWRKQAQKLLERLKSSSVGYQPKNAWLFQGPVGNVLKEAPKFQRALDTMLAKPSDKNKQAAINAFIDEAERRLPSKEVQQLASDLSKALALGGTMAANTVGKISEIIFGLFSRPQNP